MTTFKEKLTQKQQEGQRKQDAYNAQLRRKRAAEEKLKKSRERVFSRAERSLNRLLDNPDSGEYLQRKLPYLFAHNRQEVLFEMIYGTYTASDMIDSWEADCKWKLGMEFNKDERRLRLFLADGDQRISFSNPRTDIPSPVRRRMAIVLKMLSTSESAADFLLEKFGG